MDKKDNIEENITTFTLPKKVAVLYTEAKREYFQTEEAYISDADSDKYALDLKKHVNKMGIDAEIFPGNDVLSINLKKYKPDMAINLVDSVRGDMTLGASIPGLLELMHIPYTGTGILGYSINCNKFVTYQLLQASGISVPVHQLIMDPSDMIDPELRYPLLPKLNNEHSSVGIDENSICKNESELRAKLKDLFNKFHQPILVDEFIAGIELTSAVLDGLNTKVYTVRRKVGDSSTQDVVTFDKKWNYFLDLTYEKYEDPNLKPLVKKVFEVLKISDYARVDIRMDAAGRYYFIDPNVNPFFGPPEETHSTYSIILEMHGVSFEETLKRLFLNTAKDTELSNNGWH